MFTVVYILIGCGTISNICFGTCFQRPTTFIFFSERCTDFSSAFIWNSFGSETFFGLPGRNLNRTGIKIEQSLSASHGPELAASLVPPPPTLSTLDSVRMSQSFYIVLKGRKQQTDLEDLLGRSNGGAESSSLWKPSARGNLLASR